MVPGFLRRLLSPGKSEDETPPSEPTPVIIPESNCRKCRWTQNGLCLAPFEPRLFLTPSQSFIVCIDREPWWGLAMQQAHETAAAAWNRNEISQDHNEGAPY